MANLGPINPLDYGYMAELLPDYLKGYQVAGGPKRQDMADQNAYLANALKQIELQYAPQRQQAEIANLMMGASGGALTGYAREAQSLYQLEQQLGADHPLVLQAKSQVASDLARVKASTEGQEQRTLLVNYNSLNADAKARLDAAYRAAGAQNELDILNYVGQGITPQQLAKQNGMSDEQAANLEGQYALTGKNRTALNELKGASVEDSILRERTTEALAPYSQKFLGYSPQQILDASLAQGGDKESQEKVAKYLAALALQPEMALLQVRMSQGSNAHAAIKEIMERAGGNARNFAPQITPEMFKLQQKYIHEWLNEAVNARIKAMEGRPLKPAATPAPELPSRAPVSAGPQVKALNPPPGLARHVDDQKKGLFDSQKRADGRIPFIINGKTYWVLPEEVEDLRNDVGE